MGNFRVQKEAAQNCIDFLILVVKVIFFPTGNFFIINKFCLPPNMCYHTYELFVI